MIQYPFIFTVSLILTLVLFFKDKRTPNTRTGRIDVHTLSLTFDLGGHGGQSCSGRQNGDKPETNRTEGPQQSHEGSETGEEDTDGIVERGKGR